MATDTQTIEVSVPGDLLKQIDARARDRGGDRSRLILEWIEKGLKSETQPHAGMTFEELLARAQGPSPADQMTDEELAEFAESEVKTYRAEKRQAARNG